MHYSSEDIEISNSSQKILEKLLDNKLEVKNIVIPCVDQSSLTNEALKKIYSIANTFSKD